MANASIEKSRLLGLSLLTGLWLAGSSVTAGDDSRRASRPSQDQLWRRTVNLVQEGDFQTAQETIAKVTGGGTLTEQVRTWLAEYEASEAERKRLDLEDFEKYVGYAKARVAREEYWRALGWALVASDCAADRDAFLASAWLQDLVNVSLEKAGKYCQDHEWNDAFRIYSRLAALDEQEPRYQRLERDTLTHLRLDRMFGEGSHWEERIKKIRWKDAENALRHIEEVYVERPDFRPITEQGLEQILILANSKTARETFEYLQDDDKREEFVARVQKHLDQTRESPYVSRADCVQRFRRVIRSINRETVEFPEPLLVSELMRGALEPLDDFTSIIWPQASREFDKRTRGDFVGVGISIIKNRQNEIEVVTPLDNAPAYRAGVQAGDIIIEVDGEPFEKNISINSVVDIITGPQGTPVQLTIRRGTKELDFDLQRERVKIQSVKGVKRRPNNPETWNHWLDHDMGIGYIQVTNFQRNTVEDVANVLSELKAGGLKGLVLDLRGNPGGLLESAWEISSLFLKQGDTVVSTKGRIKSEDQTFRVHSTGAYSDMPLAVLVDDRSASASEIVSGATRDNGRSTVIGERTFGKFSVQNLIPLGRSGAKLKITTARYYLPSGASLHRTPTSETWGVEPNIPVRLTRWERYNVITMQREANLLGPPKPKTDKVDEAEDEEADKSDATTESVAGKDENTSDAQGDDTMASGKDKDEENEEDKLPPLDQPDENSRPKKDVQLDTALLFLRVTLFGDSFPTLATAEAYDHLKTGKP